MDSTWGKEKAKLTKELDRILGNSIQKKRIKQHQDFVEKWSFNKSLASLTDNKLREELSNALRGFTPQANKIADIIETKKMNIEIWNDKEFEDFLINRAKNSPDEAEETLAFTYKQYTVYRESTHIEDLLSELVHEGTHVLDNIQIDTLRASGKTDNEITAIMGDRWSREKRAYFHESAFQKATEMIVEYDTPNAIKRHVEKNYERNYDLK